MVGHSIGPEAFANASPTVTFVLFGVLISIVMLMASYLAYNKLRELCMVVDENYPSNYWVATPVVLLFITAMPFMLYSIVIVSPCNRLKNWLIGWTMSGSGIAGKIY